MNLNDRANIGNAKVLGLATSLKLTPNQYNLALSIFFVGYVVFETPSNVLVKRFGPRWYIPVMTVSSTSHVVQDDWLRRELHRFFGE